ncbi:MAG: hypothetical protein R3C12_14405 [Planctomycetaceae bacterium]
MNRHVCLLALILVAQMTRLSQGGYDPNVLPQGHEYYELRQGLSNCRLKFEREKRGRIAFLGGSITASKGWRDDVIRYFQTRFPETEFDFISAGISSLGSVPHAFRLQRDVLSHGPVDLLFVEAAVNDTTNTPDRDQMLRGMEGLVRPDAAAKSPGGYRAPAFCHARAHEGLLPGNGPRFDFPA